MPKRQKRTDGQGELYRRASDDRGTEALCVHREELFGGHLICCEIVPMGSDYTLAVYGGDRPHVGSVVMATARPSLTGEGISATSSVLNSVGHKDEAVARIFAETVAKAKNCTAVCVCGIHVDDITPEQLDEVQRAGARLLEQVLESLHG